MPRGYNRQLYISLYQQVPGTIKSFLDDLKALRPPSELSTKYQETVTLTQQAMQVEQTYIDSLPGLPPSQFDKQFPTLPGDHDRVGAQWREVGAAIVAVSGGKCEVANQ
jgi:hypothetical protein